MINSLFGFTKSVLGAENKTSPADKRDEANISHRGTTRFPARANTQSFCNGNARPRLPQSFIPDAPKRNALPPPTDGSQPRPSSLSRFVAKSLTSSQQFITIHGGFHTTTKISIPQNPPVCKHKCRFFNTFGDFLSIAAQQQICVLNGYAHAYTFLYAVFSSIFSYPLCPPEKIFSTYAKFAIHYCIFSQNMLN